MNKIVKFLTLIFFVFSAFPLRMQDAFALEYDDCSGMNVCGLGYYVSPDNDYFCAPPPDYTKKCANFIFCGNIQAGDTRCCIGDRAQYMCASLITPTPTPGKSTCSPNCVNSRIGNMICCDGFWQTRQDVCNSCITPIPTQGPTSTPRAFSPYEAPSNSFFDMLNPLKHAGGDDIFEDEASAYADQLSTPGGIVSRLLAFAFPLAGLILFVMLVWGGFEILIQAPSKKGIDAGKQRVSAAIIGFILLFSSYWIWQIVEVVFGIVIF